jgi:hypothetical protein
MTSRAVATVMLLVMAFSCSTHGMTVVQCRCSGQMFVGHGPESCCDDCEETEATNENGSQLADTSCLGCNVDCYIIISRGASQSSAVIGKSEAPAPVLTAAPLFEDRVSWNARHLNLKQETKREKRTSAPPGASRGILYGSLQI